MPRLLHNWRVRLGVWLLQRRLAAIERRLQLHAVQAANASHTMRTMHRMETESLALRTAHREQELQTQRAVLRSLLQHEQQQAACNCDADANLCPVHGSTYRGVDREQILPSLY